MIPSIFFKEGGTKKRRKGILRAIKMEFFEGLGKLESFDKFYEVIFLICAAIFEVRLYHNCEFILLEIINDWAHLSYLKELEIGSFHMGHIQSVPKNESINIRSFWIFTC